MGARPAIPLTDPPIPRVVKRFFEFSLLGMLAAGYFALAGSGYLDWPTATLTLIALCLRGLMAAGVVDFEIPNHVSLVFILVSIGFFPLDAWLVSGALLPATMHLVCLLASLKILTARTNRDFTYLKMVAIVELLAAAILSVSLAFFAFLALFLLFAIAAFSSGEVRRSAQAKRAVVRGGLRAFPRRLVSISVLLFGGILFMTAGLFFVLPRTARAALERIMPRHNHVSGFSNGVTLGQIGELKKNTAPVMHVRSHRIGDDGGGGFLEVRWRGAALTRFDGKRWDSRPGPTQELIPEHGVITVNRAARPRPPRAISYTVKMNERGADTLFIAGVPQTIRIDVPSVQFTPSQSFTVVSAAGMPELTYAVYSFLEDASGESGTPAPLSGRAREELLQLPPGIDPRIPHLAREMAAGADTDAERASAIESRLRLDYGYTLDLLPAAVPDPLANFLFDRKKGHCEYFASAMVVMLRTQGIPARLITGFQSGVYNPITGLQVVRESDAHSWVEAWITGRGWTTFDPTPSDPGSAAGGVIARLSLFFDAAEQFWQEWVMSYDLDRQIGLATRMDESARRWRFGWLTGWMSDAFGSVENAARVGWLYAPIAAAGAALALAGLLCGPMLLRWWRSRARAQRLARGQGEASDATVLYERMLATLARRGIQKPPWLTPAEFARVLPKSEMSLLVDRLTVFYNELRFGGRGEVAPRMMHLLDRLDKIGRLEKT
jgi:protein-glutamine gamma-glutamyltransferase